MNILWIEDQPEEHEQQLFPKKFIDGRGGNWLIKTTSFDDAYTKVISASEEADFIVIDINLEHFDVGEQGKKLIKEFKLFEKEFAAEAGFHLYLQLLQQGFDKKRIIFLSAYTGGNQFETLQRKLHEAHAEKDQSKVDSTLEEIERTIAESPDHIQDLQDAINVYDNTHSLELLDVLLEELAEQEAEKSGLKEAKNQYDKFLKIFREARLPLAKSINKTQYEDFQRWLNERLNPKRNQAFHHTVLRRGIIEGCRELKQRLDEVKGKRSELDTLLLFYKTIPDVQVSETHRQYVIDYLTKLEQFFPLRQPTNKAQMYGLFLKELCAEWEMSAWDALNKHLKAALSFSESEYRFKSYCQTQMKLLRNWTSHNVMSKTLSEKDVAYLFIIAMRGWFNLPVDEVFPYERMLAEVFEPVAQLKTDIGIELAQSYYTLRRRLRQEQFRNPYGNQFKDLLDMLTGLIEVKPEKADSLREEIQQEAMKLFYQNYWHGLFPAELNLAKTKPEKDSVAMYINFREDESMVKASFLAFLGKLILKEAFA